LSSALNSNNQNSEIQAGDLSHILSNQLQTVVSHLVSISNSTDIREQNVTEVKALLNSAEYGTSPITDYYNWNDQNGTLLASSNQTILSIARQYHYFLSDAEFFVKAAEARGTTYISNASVSPVTHLLRILVIQPVYDSRHVFKGVVAAALNLKTLGAFISGQISPIIRNNPSIGEGFTLYDANGTVLYSSKFPSTIGLNLFTQGQNLTSMALPSQRAALLAFDQKIIESRVPGMGTVPFRNETRLVAYQPIFVNNSNPSRGQQQYFGMLLLGYNENIPRLQAAQIASIGTFTALTIAGIGAGAVLALVVFLRWNRRLEDTVRLRTAELEKSNQELKMRDIAQRDFINTAAHELRTPVQPLLGMAELLRENMNEKGTKTIEISESELNLIERNAKRLSELTKNILDVTRLEGQTPTLKKEIFDLRKDIQERIDEISANLTVPKISFFASDDPLMVEGDRVRLGEVVSNLVNNAIRFSSKNQLSRLVISAEKKNNDNFALVKVKDSGPGIDSEVMPKLFTKFFTKSESGIGLGLYISKLIVEAHGGKIWAENNTGEPGASFIFTVPLLQSEKKEAVGSLPNQQGMKEPQTSHVV